MKKLFAENLKINKKIYYSNKYQNISLFKSIIFDLLL